MRSKFNSLACVTGLLVISASGAFAQEKSGTEVAANDVGLAEIVVSARKVSENIINVPVAVTAFTAEQLQERGVIDIRGLDAFTPGFTDVGGSAYGRLQRSVTSFVVRGMIPGRTFDPLRQNVSVFVDGVPVSGGNIAGLSDVEQVEIVKGPQSAYFGRSTFAGAINLTTRQPSFEWQGKIDTQLASYGTNDTTGSVEGPIISDVVAVRLSGRYYRTDGQYLNPDGGRLGEQQTGSGTAQILIKPTDNLKVSLFGTWWTDSDGPAIDGVIGGPWATSSRSAYNCNMGNAAPGVLNGICGALPTNPAYISLNKDVSSLAQVPFYNVLVLDQGVASILRPGFIDHYGMERHARELHANVEYDLPAGYTINANFGSNQSALGEINDGIQEKEPDPFYIYNGYYAEDNQQFNQDWSGELRLTSPRDRPFKWMFGTNYVVETAYSADVGWYAGPYNAATPEEERANTIGYFGSAQYDFANGFSVTGELRFQQDTVENILIALAPGSLRKTYDSTTPRFILSKKITDHANVYFSYAKGDKPGTFNINLLSLTPAQQAVVEHETAAQLAVPQETVDMYELGIKGDFLDSRLRVLADIYYGKWKDQQIIKTGLYQQVSAGGLVGEISIPEVASVGLTNLSGLEVESQYEILPGLLLEASFNLADSDIREYDCANCGTYETGTDNVTGHRLGLFPRIKGAAALSYTRNVFSDFRGYVRGEYEYRGIIYADETNLTWIGPSNKVNLRIGLGNDLYSFELFGKNILNNKQYQSIAWAGTFLVPPPNLNEWDAGPADKPVVGVRFVAKFK